MVLIISAHYTRVNTVLKKLWKRSQRGGKEDNPFGDVLFYKSKFLVSCTRTCHDPVGHTSNSTLNTCTDGTTEHTEDEGLGANNDDKSCRNFSVLSLSEKLSPADWSASNALTSRSSEKTAGNKTKRKMEYLTTIPRVMKVTFHLWNERLIFTSEEVPASEEVFASTAELCSFNFSLFPLLWNHGIAVTFCVLCTC